MKKYFYLLVCFALVQSTLAGEKQKFRTNLDEIKVSDLVFENDSVNEVREDSGPITEESVNITSEIPTEDDIGWWTKTVSYFSKLGEKYLFTETGNDKKQTRKRKKDGSFELSSDCSIDNILLSVRDDLLSLSRSKAMDARYFSFHHYYCMDQVPKQVKNAEYEDALNILLNSLSWDSDLTKAVAINEERTIFRIFLNDYKRATGDYDSFQDWNADTWSMLVEEEPYHLMQISHPLLNEISSYTFENYPIIRGDWFLATASRSPLYDKVLGYEGNIDSLYRILGMDIRDNVQRGLAVRAGFKNSGVSNFNRLLERHPTEYGGFWLSYDFAGSSGKRSFFKNPLGPDLIKRVAFEHDGGEIIFNLPNGLQAYKLINAEGDHLDFGPSEVVKHSVSSDGRVQNAVSCMGCHSEGILDKRDEVLETVLFNRSDFTSREIKVIKGVYPGADKVLEYMKEDRERYQDALSEITVSKRPGSAVVFNLTRYYEETVSVEAMAAEFGITIDHFKYIALYSNFRDTFGVLIKDGTIMRSEIENIFSAKYGDKDSLILLIQLARKRLNPNPSFGQNYLNQDLVEQILEVADDCGFGSGRLDRLRDCYADGLMDIEIGGQEQRFINDLVNMCTSPEMGDDSLQAICLQTFVKFAGLVPINSNLLAPICRDLPTLDAENLCNSRLYEYFDRGVL